MSMTVSQQDALQEVLNIGVGRAAQELNKLLQAHVSMQIPSVAMVSSQEMTAILAELSDDPLTAVWLDFSGSYSGRAGLLLPIEDASRLVMELTQEAPETPDCDASRASKLSEVGDAVISRLIEAMGNMLKQELTFSLPARVEAADNLLALSCSRADFSIIFGKSRFTIAALQIEGYILLLSPLGA